MSNFLDKFQALEDNGELEILQSDYVMLRNSTKLKIDGIYDCDNKFLNIDQSINYLNSITGINYSKTEFKNIIQRNHIKPFFYYEGYIDSPSKGISEAEKIKGYFGFNNLYNYIDQEHSYIPVPEGVHDSIFIYHLLESETNIYSDGDNNVCLYPLDPTSEPNMSGSILNSFLKDDIKFVKASLDSYFNNIDNPEIERGEIIDCDSQFADIKLTIDSIILDEESISNDMNTINTELEQKIKVLEKKIKELDSQLKVKNRINDTKELNPRTRAAVTSLLSVLFKMCGYSIEKYKGTTNTKIHNLSKELKTPISENTISEWIKDVQQLRIDKE